MTSAPKHLRFALRKRIARTSQAGQHLLEAALALPMLFLIGFGIAEPLVVLHRYNTIHHAMTSLANRARENQALSSNFWSDGYGYDDFQGARAALAARFEQAIDRIGGVSADTVRHLDRVGDEVRWKELKLGYLPPGTSAYVPQWKGSGGNPASLNNSHVCGFVPAGYDHNNRGQRELYEKEFNAAVRDGKRSAGGTLPLEQVMRARAECRPEEGEGRSVRAMSRRFPTELSAALRIRGLIGEYKVVMTVPFWPNIGPRVWVDDTGVSPLSQCNAANNCLDCKYRTTFEGPWSTTCGSGTRTLRQEDNCGNSREFVDERCVGDCGWTRISATSCTKPCGGGTRDVLKRDKCGTEKTDPEACNTQACPCYYRVNWKVERNRIGDTNNGDIDIEGTLCGVAIDTHWTFDDEYRTSGNQVGFTWWRFSKADTQFNEGKTFGSQFKAMIDKIDYDKGLKDIDNQWDWEQTLYLDESCNVITNIDNRRQCSVATVKERWDSPISLVLNRSAGLSGVMVNFRLNPTKGDAQLIQWFGSADTPLLVWDPAHEGEIRDGSQLFGTYSFGKEWKHGYEALASLDKNGDGKVSGSELSGLGVWIDANRDAVSQKGEVVTAAAFGLEELSVRPDAEQKELEKGLLWASDGAVRVVDGKRETVPTVDWFTPSGGVAAHLTEQSTSSNPVGGEPAPVPAAGGSAAAPESEAAVQRVSTSINKDTPFEVWRWGVGGKGQKIPANQGGWLTLQRDDQGNLVVMSVVVAPLNPNEESARFAALPSVFRGQEKRKGDGSRAVEFGGRRVAKSDKESGIEIRTTAVIGSDGKTMRGETVQTPFGKSNSRKVSYTWRAVRVKEAEDSSVKR